MVNASFVFGMDADEASVFDRTVEWAIEQGVETATFHILTPYPGTALHQRIKAENRIRTSNWDLYDTRHTVFAPKRLSPKELEEGYWHAYQEFYRWKNIIRSSQTHTEFSNQIRHLAYTGGWKKFEPVWDWVIRAKRVATFLPVLETVLAGFRAYLSIRTPNEVSQTVEEVTN
jgi:radical SAM superfamily enzyme YgiQ (UPF0313 family)